MPFQMSGATLEVHENFLNRILPEVAGLIRQVTISARTSDQKRLAMLVLNDLYEKAKSVSILAANSSGGGMHVTARSAFENFIDLKNLYRHPKEYFHYMMYLSQAQSLEGLRAVHSNPDRLFSKVITEGISEHLGLTVDEAFRESVEDLAGFRANLTRNYFFGNKHHSDRKAKVNTSVVFRAKLAGELDLYDSAYRMLSTHTHGNISAMLASVAGDNGFQWPPIGNRVPAMAVMLVGGMVLDGALLVAAKTRKNAPRLKEIKKERDEIMLDA